MKMPIGKIKRAMRDRGGPRWTALEVSFFSRGADGSGEATANMLLVGSEAPIVDYGYLARNDVSEVEDDGAGLVKLDVKMVSSDGDNLGYRDVFVFDGEAYAGKMPITLDSELKRAIYLAAKNGGAK